MVVNQGNSKRICIEQDYQSDRDIVNGAKNKLKREVKSAIEEITKEGEGEEGEATNDILELCSSDDD